MTAAALFTAAAMCVGGCGDAAAATSGRLDYQHGRYRHTDRRRIRQRVHDGYRWLSQRSD